LASEAPQQLRVGQLAHAFAEGGPADQLQDRAGRALGHRAVPAERMWLSTYIVPSEVRGRRLFFDVRVKKGTFSASLFGQRPRRNRVARDSRDHQREMLVPRGRAAMLVPKRFSEKARPRSLSDLSVRSK